ncbi:MarR family transcriptional regulator [Timonella sp. A28]|uniref:MarR family transcriptional regulator n=1 Tax=Timonella sp. A28 TaxID=3442640 RepID=UPI003EBA040E
MEETNPSEASCDSRLGQDLAESTQRASLLIEALAERYLRHHFDLTYHQYVLLLVLSRTEPTDATSLAECLNISRAAVSKRLPALEKAGLVRVVQDPKNGRKLMLTTTPRAAQLVEQASPELENELRNVLARTRAGFDPVLMAQLMGAMVEALEESLNDAQCQ